MADELDFIGTKIALMNNGKVLTIQRDNKPDLVWAGMWDLPGGAREAGETPFQTVAREIKEELAIDIKPEEVVWQKTYPSVIDPTKTAVFMVVNVTDEQIESIVFGDEGQGWKMMPAKEFTTARNTVPGMQTRIKDYLVSLK